MNKENDLLFFLHEDDELSSLLCSLTGLEEAKCRVSHFADGEVFAKPLCSVRDKRCFVVQSTSRPSNDRLMEMLVFIDALRNGGAKDVHLLIPYFGYARQDRQLEETDPISARLVAHLIEASGASSVLTVDVHNLKILSFFTKIKASNVACAPLFASHFADHAEKAGFLPSEVTIVSPDKGGLHRAEDFLSFFPHASLAVADKHRPRPNRAEVNEIEGKVEGQLCIIIDDMIDTAGTVVAVSKLLYEKGAKAVYVGATHGIFSGNAVTNLLNVGVKEIVVSDSINNHLEGVSYVNVAPLLAKYMESLD